MSSRKFLPLLLAVTAGWLHAETHFIEAERFLSPSSGWKTTGCRTASATNALHGAGGDPTGVAHASLTIATGGVYRIWARYQHVGAWRGPFVLAVSAAGQTLAQHGFDREAPPHAPDWDCVWESFDATLPAGVLRLELIKDEGKNCNGYVRLVDCFLLTTDLALKPDHRDYGPQTYVRVTMGEIYDQPVYVHVFADHYRAPWYGHHFLAKGGAGNGLGPAAAQLLKAGEQTPWCNLSRMLYQDSGAILNMTVRHSYHNRPERMKARFEFAHAPDASAIVRTLDVEAQPNGLVVVMPPDLVTEENRSRLGRDLDFAERTGRIADRFDWPVFGRKPTHFPFFVAAGIGGYGTQPDQSVIDRERKTLDYFGFANWTRTILGAGTWSMVSNSYCRPNLTAITNAAAARAAELSAKGQRPGDVVFSMVMDEPTGQSLAFMAGDPAYHTAFRAWLKGMDLKPADLLVADWDAVRPVTFEQRDASPALYYFSQRFRTQALGDFIAVQRRALESACGGAFPVNANFSDGSTYHANFYSQGVDYFELLDDDGQNAIWGEDWANGSSSYQCGAYNVDLMRAAARDRGQIIGHYLIAHAGRRPLDIKLKAAGNIARGVKMLESFSYGVYWGSHEGGPAWRSHVWQNKPEVWRAHAEILREIGGAEAMLMPALPPPAEVAILYASSSDIWASGGNLAFGFERMHTWMALTHAQIPVDFVSEKQAEQGQLARYRACYFSGPNLTRAAASNVSDWVRGGGTLFITAGAGARDEYNRPLATLDALLPADRGELVTLQTHQASGHYLTTLQPKGRVTVGASNTAIDVLSVCQALTPRPNARVLATNDAAAAVWVRGSAGKGTVHCLGFLPALDYIRQALIARQALVAQVKEAEAAAIDGPDASRDARPLANTPVTAEDRIRLEASSNPWDYPAAVRAAIVAPAREAGIDPPVTCSVPLVDAVYMTCDEGVVIPLANYTLHPLKQIELTVRVDRRVKQIDSVHHGKIRFSEEKGRCSFSLPLDSTDYVMIR